MYRTRSFTYLVASVFVALAMGCQSAAQSVSDQPDTPGVEVAVDHLGLEASLRGVSVLRLHFEDVLEVARGHLHARQWPDFPTPAHSGPGVLGVAEHVHFRGWLTIDGVAKLGDFVEQWARDVAAGHGSG